MTDNGSDKNAEIALEQCDDEFYKSEDEINCILLKNMPPKWNCNL